MKKFTSWAVTCVMGVLLFALSLASWCKAPQALSLTERRPLQQMPALNAQALSSGSFMKAFDNYTLDQFPLRDEFRTFKALAGRCLFAQSDNNGYFLEDGYLAKLDYPLRGESVDYAASRFAAIYEQFLAGTQVKPYLAVIPDKAVLLAQNGKHLSLDFDALRARLYAQSGFALPIELLPLLQVEDYYATDTHWRQECLTDVAQRLAEAMGVPFVEDYEAVTLPQPFYGVYYGQAALPVEADTLTYLTNEMLEGCTVLSYESGAAEPIAMYDLAAAEGQDAYELFLGGPLSLVTIENPAAATDRELVIFRDSFASSLAPLLAGSYAKITLVDIRYLPVQMVPQFIDFSDQDVLFLYSSAVLNNSETLK